MKTVRLSRTALIGGKRIRVLRLREPSLADMQKFIDLQQIHVDHPSYACAAMVSLATGHRAEEILALPVDDMVALMGALGDLSASVADRVEAAAARIAAPRSGLH